MDLKGKVALVTGGGTGLGREISRQLAQEGMHVAVNYSRSQQDAEDTVKEIKELGIEAQTVQADVAKLDDIKRMVSEVAEKFGRIDLLINNAGVTKFVPFSNLDGLEEEDWDRILAVNTKAPFFAARTVAPIMRQNGGGHIINTASIAGLRPTGSSMAYSVSKAAMIHLTRGLAIALGPDIQVNAIAPGLLVTRWGALHGEEVKQRWANNAPLKRLPTLEDCAATYIMLARNSSITGEIITVDSGSIL